MSLATEILSERYIILPRSPRGRTWRSSVFGLGRGVTRDKPCISHQFLRLSSTSSILFSFHCGLYSNRLLNHTHRSSAHITAHELHTDGINCNIFGLGGYCITSFQWTGAFNNALCQHYCQLCRKWLWFNLCWLLLIGGALWTIMGPIPVWWDIYQDLIFATWQAEE